MAKTEEQIMLERLGILESTHTSDSDFEVDSHAFDELETERQRLEDWEFQLENRESVVIAKERELKREEKRLRELAADLTAREEEFHAVMEKNKAVLDKAEYVLDDDVMDEYRRKKKIERLKQAREDATVTPNSGVWSVSGWNT